MPRVKGIKKKDKKVYNEEQSTVLFNALTMFFVNNKEYLDKIYDIVESNQTIVKLAMVDYFVTIYSKKHKCFIEKADYEYYYINDEYKNQLKSYTKKLFDPFKRLKKIDFEYDNIKMTTTVGQLNFLKWAIKNGVIEYIENHYENINAEMGKHLEEKRIRQEAKKEAKLAAKLITV